MNLISKLLPFASKSLPVALGLKGMSKIDPRIQRFVGYATSAGFGSDQIMDYLRSKLENPQDQATRSQKESDEAQGRLRPDERANLSMIRDSQRPKDIAQAGLSAAIGLGGGILGSGQQDEESIDPQEMSQVSQYPMKEEQTGLNANGFPVNQQQQQPPQQAQQPQQQKDVTQELWDRAQSAKVKVSDADVTEFLKATHNLHRYRGLSDKTMFDDLWNEFNQLIASGIGAKQAADQVMLSYNQSLSKNAQARNPKNQQAESDLIKAIQSATQARQNRQQR